MRLLSHPFTWLPTRLHKRAFLICTLAAIFIMISLNIVGLPLITDAAPSGIVSFELAGDLTTAQAMIASWGENGRLAAALSLGADYLFMPAYAAAIALGCVLVAGRMDGRRSQNLGYVLAWGQWAAALLDAVENIALIRLLFGATQPVWPPLAFWCASVKFVFIGLGLLYALGGWGWLKLRQ